MLDNVAIANRVSAERIEERISALAQIGGLPNGGMNRLPYSPEDREARTLFTSWLEAIGWSVRVDGAGNVIALKEGSEPGLPLVLTGSHLDTQPGGGRFDGIAGVVAAAEAAEALTASGVRHRRSIEVVAWAGEEGSGRFDVGLIGSRAMIGQLDDGHLQSRCRLTGQTLRDLMVESGSDPLQLDQAERAPGSIAAVVELHIEQGPYLEEKGIPVGVVSEIAGNRRIPLKIRGVQAHSGAQPMSYRRDALCAAAEIILAAESAAQSRTDPQVVATSGYSFHTPHVIAAVPGSAEMIIDVRSTDIAELVATASEISEAAAEICQRRGVELIADEVWGLDPTNTHSSVSDVIVEACNALGIQNMSMASGAGHDSLMLGKRFPAGMIFVPSRGGISHAPEEFTDNADIATGARILTATVCSLSEIV